MSSDNEIDYTRLREEIVNVYRKAGGTRPDVMHVIIDNQDYVVKDYNPTSGWFGLMAGPFLVKREIKALNKLQGIKGIPQLFPCTNKRVLITEYCESQSAAKLQRPLNWLKFEEGLKALISEMHSAGVAHCDLRGPGNILIDNEDNPYLVDYVGCIFKTYDWNRPWNFLFKQGCKADISAILKLKQKLAPEQLTVKESSLVEKNSSKGWLFRKTSRGLRRLARWIFAAGKN